MLKNTDQDIQQDNEQNIKEVFLDHEDPQNKLLIGVNMPQVIEQGIITFLKNRRSTFASKHEDLTCISKDVITLKVGIDKSCRANTSKEKKVCSRMKSNHPRSGKTTQVRND